METITATFNELDASRLFVRLVNDLDHEPFIAKLAHEVRYQSQWVLTDLYGSEPVAKLLRGKTETAKKDCTGGDIAALGVAMRGDSRMPLVILTDRKTNKVEATVSFRIAEISFCMLGVYKPAFLENGDSYVWPPAALPPEPEPEKPAPKVREPDPDPAAIIATFAVVVADHRAPIDDVMIAA